MKRRAGGDGWEECSRVSVKLQVLYKKKKHDNKKDSRLRKLASHDGVSLRVNNLSAEHEGKKKRKTRRFKQVRKKKKKEKQEKPEMRKKQRKPCGAKTTAWGKLLFLPQPAKEKKLWMDKQDRNPSKAAGPGLTPPRPGNQGTGSLK